MRMGMDDVLSGIMSAPPLLALVWPASTWMWNAAEDRSPASSCVDAGIIFTGALAQFGIATLLGRSQCPLSRGTLVKSDTYHRFCVVATLYGLRVPQDAESDA